MLIVLPTCSAGVFTGSICWLVLEAGGRGGSVRDPQEALTSEKGGCSSCSTKDNPEDWFLGNRVWRRFMGSLTIFWQVWPVVEQGVSTQVGGWDTAMIRGWWPSKGWSEECTGRVERGGGEAAAGVYCSAREDPEDWIWGNRESGEDLWPAYLIWQA